jgi:hypothetical protein
LYPVDILIMHIINVIICTSIAKLKTASCVKNRVRLRTIHQ